MTDGPADRWQEALRRHQAGDLDAADSLYRALQDERPGDDAVLTKRALVALQRRDLEAALTLAADAARRNPGNVEARLWHAEALRQSGDANGAAEALRRVAADAPTLAPAWFNLGLAEDARGDADAARVAFERFAVLRPSDARVWREIGRLARRRGSHAEAAAAFAEQARRAPGDAAAAFDAGLEHERCADLLQARAWLAQAAALAPARADIPNAQGVVEFNLADHVAAVRHYRDALRIEPGSRDVHANLLMALHHASPVDAAALAAAHADAVASMPPASARMHELGGPRDPERPLAVGYVSPRFCAGPLEHMMLPLLDSHDRARHAIHCYATSSADDRGTAAMRAQATAWHDVAALDDEALAARIRADRIDVLVDLVGHCPGHSLRAFARRAAPVQVTWLDYVDTTLVPAMDVLVGDALHMPVDGGQTFSETLVRMARPRFVYRLATPPPPLAPPPILARGAPTFGCFNRLAKVGPPVMAAWSSILLAVPNARLVLKATALASAEVRDEVRARFAAHGIDAARLDLRGFSDEATMLAQYGDVDVALDPFPYSGCNTTCDALVMGVPVVTLRGTRIAGLHSTAILTACGQDTLVAPDVATYVARAVELSRDVPRLVALRRALRGAIEGSPLMDAPSFARDFEAVIRAAWRRACAA